MLVLLVGKAPWEPAHPRVRAAPVPLWLWSSSSEVMVSTHRGLAGHRASLGTDTEGGPRAWAATTGGAGRGKRYSQWAGWEMGAGLCSTHRAARGRYLKHNNYFILNITMLFRLCPLLEPSTACEEETPRLGVGEATVPSCVVDWPSFWFQKPEPFAPGWPHAAHQAAGQRVGGTYKGFSSPPQPAGLKSVHKISASAHPLAPSPCRGASTPPATPRLSPPRQQSSA